MNGTACDNVKADRDKHVQLFEAVESLSRITDRLESLRSTISGELGEPDCDTTADCPPLAYVLGESPQKIYDAITNALNIIDGIEAALYTR